jgi:hypothetical protein
MKRDVLSELQLLQERIRPYLQELAKVSVAGEIAVVLCNPSEHGRAVARELGWDGDATVFCMSEAGRRRMVDALSSFDPIRTRWLKRAIKRSSMKSRPEGRIFFISGQRTLLVNYRPGKGFSVEPGSIDAKDLS